MGRNGGAVRPGHVAGEHVGTPVREKLLGARQCCLTHARQWQWRWRRGRGSSGEALGGLAWPETGRKARAESLTHGGAHRGRKRRGDRALEGEMRPASAQEGIVASKWRCSGWQVGSPSMYGCHGVSTRRPTGDQSPSTVTKTQTWPTFYSWFTWWFLLGFVPMDRATQVLQVCLKDQGLVWPRIQTTMLPSTLPRIA